MLIHRNSCIMAGVELPLDFLSWLVSPLAFGCVVVAAVSVLVLAHQVATAGGRSRNSAKWSGRWVWYTKVSIHALSVLRGSSQYPLYRSMLCSVR
jgi:hypothetical protein